MKNVGSSCNRSTKGSLKRKGLSQGSWDRKLECDFDLSSWVKSVIICCLMSASVHCLVAAQAHGGMQFTWRLGESVCWNAFNHMACRTDDSARVQRRVLHSAEKTKSARNRASFIPCPPLLQHVQVIVIDAPQLPPIHKPTTTYPRHTTQQNLTLQWKNPNRHTGTPGPFFGTQRA